MNIKIKIRDQSRTRIKEVMDTLAKANPLITQENIRLLIDEVETMIYQKHLDVDHFYKKKIQDFIENLKYLQKFKDVAEIILVRRNVSIAILLTNGLSF